MRRHAVPRAKPCVVDALLRVLLIAQNIAGNSGTVPTVLHVALIYGPLISVPVHLNDTAVLHRTSPLTYTDNIAVKN